MSRRSGIACALAVAAVLAACSGKDEAATQARGTPSTDAERKAVAALARRSAEANAVVDARNAAGRPRTVAPLRAFEGSWTSTKPFAGGRLRMTIGRDGAIVAETLTKGGATSASAIGTVSTGPSGTARGTLSRPYGPLKPFASMTFGNGARGRIIVSAPDTKVELAPERS